MTDIDEIKNRLDIVDVVGETVQLRKSGSSYSGFCPFHANTRTPAFVVFPESGTWRCFGACATGGDVFSFVMKKNGWDFKEALTDLAQRAGVELTERRPKDKAKVAAEDRLLDLLDTAATYYHQLLLHAPQAAGVRDYIAGRALTEETVAAFRLGFALDSWDTARSHFNDQGYSDDDLLRVGLLTENEEKGTKYDRFRGRLMIPIRDLKGRVRGFGARTLDPEGIPKYLNSPQTAFFDKSHLLYGLDMARRPILDAKEVVLVEGYMDVMQGWQAGYRNLVAQMGTALTGSQLRMLQRFAKRYVLALDADEAGAGATLRSLKTARETLDREYDVSFDARGLVRMEGRLKGEIRVVTLPEGRDPDDIIRTNPEQWSELVAEARPVVEYVIQVTTRDLAANDGKGKSAVADEVLPLINDIADPVERDHYVKMLARALAVDEAALRQKTGKQRQSRQTAAKADSRRRVRPEAPPRSLAGGVTKGKPAGRRALSGRKEADFLRQCMAWPGALAPVNDTLRRNGLAEVSADDFSSAIDQGLFLEIERTAMQGAFVPDDEMWDSLDAVLAERAASLLALPPTPESKLDRLPDSLALSVMVWRKEKMREQVNELSREPSIEGREALREQLIQDIRDIDRARDGLTAMGQRRAEEGAGGRSGA